MISIDFHTVVSFDKVTSLLYDPDDTCDFEFSGPIMLFVFVELFRQIHDWTFQCTIVIPINDVFHRKSVFLHNFPGNLMNSPGVAPLLAGVDVIQEGECGIVVYKEIRRAKDPFNFLK